MDIKKTDIIEDIRKNWSIIITVSAMVFAWATLDAKVTAQAKEVESVRTLLERVIILEEHDKEIIQDIAEIKADVKILLKQTR